MTLGWVASVSKYIWLWRIIQCIIHRDVVKFYNSSYYSALTNNKNTLLHGSSAINNFYSTNHRPFHAHPILESNAPAIMHPKSHARLTSDGAESARMWGVNTDNTRRPDGYFIVWDKGAKLHQWKALKISGMACRVCMRRYQGWGSRWRNAHGQCQTFKILQSFPILNCYSRLMWGTLTLKVLVATIDAQWEGMGDVGSARYEPALLPRCPTIRVLSHSN